MGDSDSFPFPALVSAKSLAKPVRNLSLDGNSLLAEVGVAGRVTTPFAVVSVLVGVLAKAEVPPTVQTSAIISVRDANL